MALRLVGSVAAGAARVYFDVDTKDTVVALRCENDTDQQVRVDVRRASASWTITATVLPALSSLLSLANNRRFRYSDEATSDWSVSITTG